MGADDVRDLVARCHLLLPGAALASRCPPVDPVFPQVDPDSCAASLAECLLAREDLEGAAQGPAVHCAGREAVDRHYP